MSWYKKLPIIPCIKCIIYISQIPKLLWRESTVPSPASEEKLCLGIIEGMLYCLIVWYVRGSPFREEGCRMWKGGSQEDGSQRSRQRRFFAPDSDFQIIILILILILMPLLTFCFPALQPKLDEGWATTWRNSICGWWCWRWWWWRFLITIDDDRDHNEMKMSVVIILKITSPLSFTRVSLISTWCSVFVFCHHHHHCHHNFHHTTIFIVIMKVPP